MYSHRPRRLSALPLFALLLLLIGSACVRNSFSLSGNLSDSEGETLYLSWRAASGKQDFLASYPLPLTGGSFRMEGPTKYPSVIWVFSSGRRLLGAIYVERGDKLTLTGSLRNPYGWQIKGNKVMEAVSSWMAANAGTLSAGNPAETNRLVSAYVKDHPHDQAALFLLLTLYSRKQNPTQYESLLSGFTDKKMVREMLRACLEPDTDMPLSPQQTEKIARMLNPDSIPADTLPADTLL